MRGTIALLLLLLLALETTAGEPGPRARLERILTARDCDLTAEVNALLALGRDAVRPELEELFRRMRVKRCAASGYRTDVESLVAILGGNDAAYEPPWWDLGTHLVVLDGFVLRFENYPDGAGWCGNWHYSWRAPPPLDTFLGDGWRAPLEPDPEVEKRLRAEGWLHRLQLEAAASDTRKRATEARAKLELARLDPSPEALDLLASAIGGRYLEGASAETRAGALELGVRLLDAGSKPLAGPARRLLGSVLQPWSFPFDGTDSDEEYGAWFSLTSTARRILADVDAGSLTEGIDRSRGPSPFAATVSVEGRDATRDWEQHREETGGVPGYARHLSFSLIREDDRLRLTIGNDGDRLVVLNRTALHYGEAQWLDRDPYLRLVLGRIPLRGLGAVPTAAFVKIPPGESWSGGIPLPGTPPRNTRFMIEFHDPFLVEGSLEGLRLVSFEVSKERR